MRALLPVGRAVTVFATASLLGPSTALGTPSAAEWRREVLLGVDREAYVVWVARWWQNGWNHRYEESMALERRSLVLDAVLESFPLGTIRGIDIDGLGWTREQIRESEFDLGRFVATHGVSPVFPARSCEVGLEQGALVLRSEDELALLMTADELRAAIPDLSSDATVSSCYHVPTRGQVDQAVHFFAIRYGHQHWDTSWAERLVRVSGEAYEGARRKIANSR